MSAGNEKPYLTASEVADLLMVSPNSVRLWADRGLLKAETTLGGHRRFARQEIERLRQTRSAPERKKGVLRSILIIDDERELADTWADGIRTTAPEITVLTANDGFEGGLKASLHKPDMILLDLMMPGMDGFEVCRLLKREPVTKNIRIIALSGLASQDNVDRIIEAGAETCLAKPIRVSKLLEVLGLTAWTPPL